MIIYSTKKSKGGKQMFKIFGFDVDFVFLNIPVSFEYEFKIGKKRHGNRPQPPFPPYPPYANRDV